MLSSAESKLIRGLARRKIRERKGLFLAEGVRVVEDLLAAGLDLRLAVISPTLEDTERGRALARALEAAVPVRRVEPRELDALAGTEAPQGVLAVAATPHHDLAALEVAGPATVLALDAVQDPGNFGTLVRAAEAFAVAFVAALPGTVDPWNPKAVRSAAGASFRVPIVQPSAGELVEWARERGFTIYGAAADGAPVDPARLAQRAVLVVGNEGAGLGAEVAGAVDEVLAIPMPGRAESLNVAVAAGILLYLLTGSR